MFYDVDLRFAGLTWHYGLSGNLNDRGHEPHVTIDFMCFIFMFFVSRTMPIYFSNVSLFGIHREFDFLVKS